MTNRYAEHELAVLGLIYGQAHHEWNRRLWHIGQPWDSHPLSRTSPAV